MSEEDWWETDNLTYTTDDTSKSKSGTVTITDQVEMFTIDIENGDSSDGYWYTANLVDDMCIPVDYTISYGGVHTANYMAGEAESKAREITHHAKEFRSNVETLLIDIKRVSPAGSASFELAKDFMDKHYGEESN